MKIIATAAAKGGTGKTTVTLNLAVRAAQESMRVAMIDLNADQGDLTAWWILRGEPFSPRIVEVEKINRDIEQLRAERYDYVLIDTPPGELDITDHAILKASAVIIPCRPSFFDMNAVTPIVEMCRERHAPYSFLLSAVDSKMPKLVESTMAALVKHGPIFATRIPYIQAYIASLMKGKSAAEIDKARQPEISNLWEEVKRLANTTPRLQAVKDREAS
jgi:chromosome partitioning protein